MMPPKIIPHITLICVHRNEILQFTLIIFQTLLVLHMNDTKYYTSKPQTLGLVRSLLVTLNFKSLIYIIDLLILEYQNHRLSTYHLPAIPGQI